MSDTGRTSVRGWLSCCGCQYTSWSLARSPGPAARSGGVLYGALCMERILDEQRVRDHQIDNAFAHDLLRARAPQPPGGVGRPSSSTDVRRTVAVAVTCRHLSRRAQGTSDGRVDAGDDGRPACLLRVNHNLCAFTARPVQRASDRVHGLLTLMSRRLRTLH